MSSFSSMPPARALAARRIEPFLTLVAWSSALGVPSAAVTTAAGGCEIEIDHYIIKSKVPPSIMIYAANNIMKGIFMPSDITRAFDIIHVIYISSVVCAI